MRLCVVGYRDNGQPCRGCRVRPDGGEASGGVKISAPEEIAFRNGWITKEKLLESAACYGKSPYGRHLKNVADGKLV